MQRYHASLAANMSKTLDAFEACLAVKLPRLGHAEPSPCMRLQLFAGTSLLLWLGAIKAIEAAL